MRSVDTLLLNDKLFEGCVCLVVLSQRNFEALVRHCSRTSSSATDICTTHFFSHTVYDWIC